MSRKPRKPRKHGKHGGETHVFRSKGGVMTVRITEHEGHVSVLVGGKHEGPLSPRMDREFDRWLRPLLEPYEDDGRPLWIDHEDGTRRAYVNKTNDDRVVVAMATKIE